MTKLFCNYLFSEVSSESLFSRWGKKETKKTELIKRKREEKNTRLRDANIVAKRWKKIIIVH